MLSNLVHHLFNSHPHKEDDVYVKGDIICISFSTHILTRRMTKPSTVNVRNIIFSTHILTRRMTQRRDHYVYGRCIFNSHPHKEDDEVIWATSCDIAFSTHILTRRMTCRQFADNRYRVFQLTSSQGGWLIFILSVKSYHIFQLTSSQGGWPERDTSTVGAFDFQLTSSQGGWRREMQI